jgi:adenosylcobyric acid synthase
MAAGVEPEVVMNPILLKPTGERTSQVMVMGQPFGHVDAAAYQAAKPQLFSVVVDALDDLRRRFDVVVGEGAGSPAEINLDDIVNLRVARHARWPVVVVGDIDRGGVFAALYGTVALLNEADRALVGGLIINKFRGDPALLGDGPAQLAARSGVPVLGVLPLLDDVALDAEDSMALSGRRPRAAGPPLADGLDVAAVAFPRLSNFTDLDALALEPGVTVRLVADPGALGRPDLVLLPGTKATVGDLEWLRGRGLDRAIAGLDAPVLGICGGYQMLGRCIHDEVESGRGRVPGLGWLDADTSFRPAKVTRQRRGRALGQRVRGYEIHHGITTAAGPGWLVLDDAHGHGVEGAGDPERDRFVGTTLHGLFEEDGFRAAWLELVARRRGKRFRAAGVNFRAARDAQYDRLADALEAHVDVAALERLIAGGAPG